MIKSHAVKSISFPRHMPDDATEGAAKHSSRLQSSVNLHASYSPAALVPMYYLKGMKARVSLVQSIEPHSILAPTWDLNQGPPGLQSRVVTNILQLHTNAVNGSGTREHNAILSKNMTEHSSTNRVCFFCTRDAFR